MKLGKTRSNIGWEIENQYEILSQLIDDIAEHYQDEAQAVEKVIDEIYQEYSNSDYETFSNETRGYGDILDKQFSLCYEARKILFCAIFSYFESMLYGIISFYKISRGKTRRIDKLLKIVCEEYEARYSSKLIIDEVVKNTIIDNYRPLRNFYMHGKLDEEMRLLISYAMKEPSINYGLCANYEIKDNDYLRIALNDIKGFLDGVENAYGDKSREF